VALTGAFTKAELAKLLAGADCFVFPSERETFGIVLAEAMAAGLPVLGPDRTAPPEFVGDHAGVLVPPDDVDAIADGLESLLSGLSTYDAAAIRSAVVERFGLPAFGERLHDLYSEVVGRREDAPCAA
jgi:glycosyltransferase involved in cell wall biosynthesis